MEPRTNSTIKGLILDMDGVLWRAAQPIGDLPGIFNRIQRSTLEVILATNNASRTPRQHLEHIASFGVSCLRDWQVINSAQAATNILIDHFPKRGPVYIVGETPLAEMLVSAGFSIDDRNALAVIASIDRSFSYEKLTTAQRLILNGALFLATNTDRTFPIPGGLVPGAGSIVAAIEAATGTMPIIAGKPSPDMYQIALRKMQLLPEEVLVVGDRLETDIVGAQAIGCQTALVLSGVNTKEQAEAWHPNPDFILPNLTSLLDVLEIGL